MYIILYIHNMPRAQQFLIVSLYYIIIIMMMIDIHNIKLNSKNT